MRGLRERTAAKRAGGITYKTPKVAKESAAERAGSITYKAPDTAKRSAAERAGNISGKSHTIPGASTTAIERAGDLVAKRMGKLPTGARRLSYKETVCTRMTPKFIGETVKRIPLANVEGMSPHLPKFMRWRG